MNLVGEVDNSRWLARKMERLSLCGGAFDFEQYVERVAARNGKTNVDIQLVKFPSGRLRVYSLTALTEVVADTPPSLQEEIFDLQQRFGLADRVTSNEAYPRHENRTWNGFWEYKGQGSGNWLAIDLISDEPVISQEARGPQNPEDFIRLNQVLKKRTSFNALEVGRQAQTAWVGENADWALDPVSKCRVWNNYPRDGDLITWSGKCARGKADGFGTLKWSNYGHVYESVEGTFVGGRINGFARVTLSDTRWFEGEFRSNLPNGPGTLFERGQAFTGNWKDGCLTQNGRSRTFYVHRDLCEPF